MIPNIGHERHGRNKKLTELTQNRENRIRKKLRKTFVFFILYSVTVRESRWHGDTIPRIRWVPRYTKYLRRLPRHEITKKGRSKGQERKPNEGRREKEGERSRKKEERVRQRVKGKETQVRIEGVGVREFWRWEQSPRGKRQDDRGKERSKRECVFSFLSPVSPFLTPFILPPRLSMSLILFLFLFLWVGTPIFYQCHQSVKQTRELTTWMERTSCKLVHGDDEL